MLFLSLRNAEHKQERKGTSPKGAEKLAMRGGVCYNKYMNQTTEILDSLNDEQIKPVLATEGAVLVLAGAGSGKTRVLTARIAHLVEDLGVPPSAILAITFTNKAANEMKERVARLADTREMWVCTIHSMCVRILRRYPEQAGIKENFSIYSETERNNIVKKSFQECDFDDDKFLKSVKWHIANAKMLGLSPEEYGREYAAEGDIDDIVKVRPLPGAPQREQFPRFRRSAQRDAAASQTQRRSARISRRQVPLHSRGRVSGHQRGAV